jgi:hypothetical protein
VIRLAARSAIPSTAALVLPETIEGMTDAELGDAVDLELAQPAASTQPAVPAPTMM